MKLLHIASLLVMLLAAQTAQAESGGSLWGSINNVPAENDNVQFSLYAERDYQHYRAEKLSFSSFIDGTISADSKGYDWNNKLLVRFGGKLKYQLGSSGHAALRFGAAVEHRFKTSTTDAAAFMAAEYWLGWGYGTKFPGSSWGVVGNTSPSEKGNVIAMINIEQGMFVQQVSSGSVVPFVEARITRDTDKYDWNNKNSYGIGVKYRHSIADNATFDIGLKYQYEERIRSSNKSDGAVIFAGFWKGF
jgi:hypothetical protein